MTALLEGPESLKKTTLSDLSYKIMDLVIRGETAADSQYAVEEFQQNPAPDDHFQHKGC